MNIKTKALSLTTSATIWLIVVITLSAELSSPLKNFLTNLTGHHWVTKGVATASFFVLLYLIIARFTEEASNIKKETVYVLWSSILGGLVIFIFYLWHFFFA